DQWLADQDRAGHRRDRVRHRGAGLAVDRAGPGRRLGPHGRRRGRPGGAVQLHRGGPPGLVPADGRRPGCRAPGLRAQRQQPGLRHGPQGGPELPVEELRADEEVLRRRQVGDRAAHM
ncbi:MAG: hypothetical protein AVDCRST_MAG50-3058, partial [uncultured Acidimicrobiales bacterium]